MSTAAQVMGPYVQAMLDYANSKDADKRLLMQLTAQEREGSADRELRGQDLKLRGKQLEDARNQFAERLNWDKEERGLQQKLGGLQLLGSGHFDQWQPAPKLDLMEILTQSPGLSKTFSDMNDAGKINIGGIDLRRISPEEQTERALARTSGEAEIKADTDYRTRAKYGQAFVNVLGDTLGLSEKEKAAHMLHFMLSGTAKPEQYKQTDSIMGGWLDEAGRGKSWQERMALYKEFKKTQGVNNSYLPGLKYNEGKDAADAAVDLVTKHAAKLGDKVDKETLFRAVITDPTIIAYKGNKAELVATIRELLGIATKPEKENPLTKLLEP